MIPCTLSQTLHLNKAHVRLLAAHVALLDAASRELFGRDYTPDLPHLRTRLLHCASQAAYPSAVSGFVRLELTTNGEEHLIPCGVSLYDGYALRSLHPTAVTLHYDLPLGYAPTSARAATAALARQQAQRKGFTAAVQCTHEGIVLAAEDAPLYGIAGKRFYASPLSAAEQTLTRAAATRVGLTLDVEPLHLNHLASLDELFWVDHRGVTALASCDGLPLMSLTAERIAKALEVEFLTM